MLCIPNRLVSVSLVEVAESLAQTWKRFLDDGLKKNVTVTSSELKALKSILLATTLLLQVILFVPYSLKISFFV